jgi:hypothetical protein
MFVTAVPRGGAPVFSTSTSPVTGADPKAKNKHSSSTHKVTVKTKPAVTANPPATSRSHTQKPSVTKSSDHPRGPGHK